MNYQTSLSKRLFSISENERLLLAESRHSSRAAELVAELVARLKDPMHGKKARDQEAQDHTETDFDGDVGVLIECPAKTTDQIYDRVKHANRLPGRWQHAD